jgi:hypothetical protein
MAKLGVGFHIDSRGSAFKRRGPDTGEVQPAQAGRLRVMTQRLLMLAALAVLAVLALCGRAAFAESGYHAHTHSPAAAASWVYAADVSHASSVRAVGYAGGYATGHAPYAERSNAGGVTYRPAVHYHRASSRDGGAVHVPAHYGRAYSGYAHRSRYSYSYSYRYSYRVRYHGWRHSHGRYHGRPYYRSYVPSRFTLVDLPPASPATQPVTTGSGLPSSADGSSGFNAWQAAVRSQQEGRVVPLGSEGG